MRSFVLRNLPPLPLPLSLLSSVCNSRAVFWSYRWNCFLNRRRRQFEFDTCPPKTELCKTVTHYCLSLPQFRRMPENVVMAITNGSKIDLWILVIAHWCKIYWNFTQPTMHEPYHGYTGLTSYNGSVENVSIPWKCFCIVTQTGVSASGGACT